MIKFDQGIIGCKARMQTFNLFYDSHLGYKLYSISHNLSKTLQAEKYVRHRKSKSIVYRLCQKVASIMVKTLEGTRKTSDAKAFFDSGLEA